MASNPYVKSLIWLVSLGGIGYVLMEVTAPSEAKLEKIRASASSVRLTEDERNKRLFLQKLQSATIGNNPGQPKKDGTE